MYFFSLNTPWAPLFALHKARPLGGYRKEGKSQVPFPTSEVICVLCMVLPQTSSHHRTYGARQTEPSYKRLLWAGSDFKAGGATGDVCAFSCLI